MDKVKIIDLEVYARHGVYPEETALGQKFLISAVLEMDTRKAGRLDNLSEAVDYGHAAHFMDKFLREHTFKLIEAAAEALAEALLLKFPISAAEIEIKKPWAPILLPVNYVAVSIRRAWHHAYLSVGSNLGDRQENIIQATERLKEDHCIRLGRISDLIETEPYGYKEQEPFLNGAMELWTLYTPVELLHVLHDIEEAGGRERVARWGPRTIDLDLLFYDNEILAEPELVVPHPEIARRIFVLQPMCQIAPWKVHPVLRKSMAELLEKIQDPAEGDLGWRGFYE